MRGGEGQYRKHTCAYIGKKDKRAPCAKNKEQVIIVYLTNKITCYGDWNITCASCITCVFTTDITFD